MRGYADTYRPLSSEADGLGMICGSKRESKVSKNDRDPQNNKGEGGKRRRTWKWTWSTTWWALRPLFCEG